jgi:hypothetical protein
MGSMGTEAVAARSGAIARIQFGKVGPYLPLMSELRRQLLTLESAVAVARATAEPNRALFPEKRGPALVQAANLLEAIDEGLDWIRASQTLTYTPVGFIDRMPRWISEPLASDSLGPLRDAQEKAAAAVNRFNRMGSLSTKELAARALIDSVNRTGRKAEELALEVYAAREKVREIQSEGRSPAEVLEAAEKVSEQGDAVRQQIRDLLGERAAIQNAALALLPSLAYGPGEDLPILRIKQESPLEVVVILIGSAGALVAALNGLLDVQVKYKTRKEKEGVERSRLERELAEDEVKTEAIKRLRITFSSNEPRQLKMQEFAVFDSLEEAFEDDEEMKAT